MRSPPRSARLAALLLLFAGVAAAPVPRATVTDMGVSPARLASGRGGRVSVTFTLRGDPGRDIPWRIVLDVEKVVNLAAVEMVGTEGSGRDGERAQVELRIPPDAWGTLGIEAHVLNGGEDWREFSRVEVVLDPPSNVIVPD